MLAGVRLRWDANMDNLKVGSRVQMTVQNAMKRNIIKKGNIIGNSVKDAFRCAVEWDDGSVEKVEVSKLILCPDLEEDFARVCKQHLPQIHEKLNAAAKLINEAEAISEEHGVPFRPQHDIMFCTPSYIPASFKQKWGEDLDYDLIYELTDAGGSYDGWQQSQTC